MECSPSRRAFVCFDVPQNALHKHQPRRLQRPRADRHSRRSAEYRSHRLAGIAKDDSREFGSDPDDPGPLAKDLSPALKTAAIDKAIRKVADWQLAQSSQYFGTIDRANQLDGRIWTWSVLYTGYSAAADTLNEPHYRDAMEKVGEGHQWGLAHPLPHGDDMSIAQMYLELYLHDKQPEQLAPIKTALDTFSPARASSLAPASASPGGGATPSSWPRPPGPASTPSPATQIHHLPR